MPLGPLNTRGAALPASLPGGRDGALSRGRKGYVGEDSWGAMCAGVLGRWAGARDISLLPCVSGSRSVLRVPGKRTSCRLEKGQREQVLKCSVS